MHKIERSLLLQNGVKVFLKSLSQLRIHDFTKKLLIFGLAKYLKVLRATQMFVQQFNFEFRTALPLLCRKNTHENTW